jgi:glycosyltransferase involved in cell wall biosynthesis
LKGQVLIFQQIVPAYRVPVFRALYRKCGSLLCHSRENRNSRIVSAAGSIDFPHLIIQNRDRFGTWQKILPTLKRVKPEIVIAGVAVSNFTFLKLVLLKKLFRYKLIAWGHGVHNSETNRPLQGIRGTIMKYYFRHSDALLFYSEGRKNLVIKKLPELEKKCFVAWNTLDLTINRFQLSIMEGTGKQAIRSELGSNFNAKYHLVFVGRLLPEKRLDLLLETFSLLIGKLDVALHIIGDGPGIRLLEAHPFYKKSIFHYGALYDETISGKFLFASDLFVMPGYVGLSVIHAFSYGIPVITCNTGINGPFHSPEIEYLIDDYNGALSESDPSVIAEMIAGLLQNAEKMEWLKTNALKTAYEECTIDRMIEGFEKAIHYVKSH